MRGGAVIAEARRRAGLTQSVLAGRLGTTKSAVSRWENGQVEPSFAAVVRAAEACTISLASLVVAERPPDPHDVSLLETGLGLTLSERFQRLIDTAAFIEAGRKSLGVPTR